MARNAGGRKALVVVVLLTLFAGPAQGLPWQPSSAIHVVVAHDTQSEKLVCTVTQTLPPSRKGELTVRIKVPRNHSLHVASGQRGSHFHQNHRGPGTHPVARRRIFALPVGARVA